ncbi:MAG: helix-turn-helix transcriptional regulator [Acetobacter sp.]|nr:helix-turn-helix transcriptional regulator [Acetobacter sp.]
MEQITNLEDLYNGSGSGLCNRFRRELGILLIKERKKHNLSLEELCEKLTLNIEVVSDLERGQNRTHWRTLCRMLDYYNKWLTIQLVDLDYPHIWQ